MVILQHTGKVFCKMFVVISYTAYCIFNNRLCIKRFH